MHRSRRELEALGGEEAWPGPGTEALEAWTAFLSWKGPAEELLEALEDTEGPELEEKDCRDWIARCACVFFLEKSNRHRTEILWYGIILR